MGFHPKAHPPAHQDIGGRSLTTYTHTYSWPWAALPTSDYRVAPYVSCSCRLTKAQEHESSRVVRQLRLRAQQPSPPPWVWQCLLCPLPRAGLSPASPKTVTAHTSVMGESHLQEFIS